MPHPKTPMPSTSTVVRRGTRGQPERTRAAILDAAMAAFAQEGLAGARTDAIARAAGVNKALLYYYFRDKQSLYGAVLDRVFAGLGERISEALDRPLPPREKILTYAAAHFDYIASTPLYPRLVYRELMRASRRGSPQIRRLVQQYFRPTFVRVGAVVREGIASGDFRPVDPMQFLLSAVACIVFYFTSTPVLEAVTGEDPLAPERVAARRAAVLDFISAALFVPYPQAKATRHGRSRNGEAK